MTVSSTTRKAGPYTGNGVADTFAFDFVVFVEADVVVVRTDLAGIETTLTLHDDYSVALNPDQNAAPGGSVTLPAALAQDFLLTLTSDVPILQTLDLTNQGGFHPDVINKALDRLTILAQQLAEGLSRSIKLGISDPTPADEYRDALLQSAADAVAAAGVASAAANAAGLSEAAADLSEAAAAASELAASLSATSAGNSKDSIDLSEANVILLEAATAANKLASDANAASALVSKNAAALSESNASTSEANAKDSELLAKGYAEATGATLMWTGVPIGCYITPFEPPPTDDPSFRYVLCTAGESGSGGYNEGVLTNESVAGSGALITANADISLAGSPMDGINIPLINTEGRFIGAGDAEALENDMAQGHHHLLFGGTGGSAPFSQRAGIAGGSGGMTDVPMTAGGASAVNKAGLIVTDGTNGTPRTGNRNQPKTHRLPHYRRIL